MVVKYFIFCVLTVSVQSDVIVQTTSGQIKGDKISSGLFAKYFAFKGIPFAEPPVGELRFRAPVPHKGWTDVRDATKFGQKCLSTGILNILSGGSEDCLYLNIYTNDITANSPVMVWLYGGAFLLGDGDSFMYGPESLLKEDVIVVTLNYRLGAFGFLSTGDKHAQGNYGLKDALLALQWIKNNIKNFGGDDTKITLAGQSAGGVLAHHLSVSPLTQGLFNRVLLMSGNIFLPFSFQMDPLKKAKSLAKNMEIQFNSTEDLMSQLRAADHSHILKYTRSIMDQDYPYGNRPFDFVLVVEPEDSTDERFITQNPEDLIASGNYRQVPMIIGTTSKEALLNIFKTFTDPSLIEDYNHHPEYFVPMSFNISENDIAHTTEIGIKFRSKYFDGKTLTNDMKNEFATFNTDETFSFPTDRVLSIYSHKENSPIYHYKFSYDGAFNMIKLFTFAKGYKGACHADDLFYLFDQGFPIFAWPWDHAYAVKKRLIRLWANFIKTGNPTPVTDDIIAVEWPEYSSTDQKYLDIDHDLLVKTDDGNLQIWRDFQKRFTNHL